MARHEVVIHENTSAATHAAAPYTGSYISKETLRMAASATAIGAKCGLPAIQVMAILGGAFEAIEALERDGLVKVMSVADDETGETFTYGDTWSVRGEGFTGTAPGWAVNMAFVQLEPEAEDPVVLDFDVRGAAEIKLDSKPEHPVAAGDYPDAKLLIEFCHPDGEDPETQVSETLEMPIHIVSNE